MNWNAVREMIVNIFHFHLDRILSRIRGIYLRLKRGKTGQANGPGEDCLSGPIA
jgi:hypothetical protein